MTLKEAAQFAGIFVKALIRVSVIPVIGGLIVAALWSQKAGALSACALMMAVLA